jgi:nucleoside phosphorylase
MASNEPQTKAREDYTIGWICALSIEQTAATAMLDTIHNNLPKAVQDGNTYTLGSIGEHNVVIACLPQGRSGTIAAANVVTNLARTFPSVRSCLLVGIGGGVPCNKVRLGDVVVGTPQDDNPGVLQWDMGRVKEGGQVERTGALDNPPLVFLTALSKLRTQNELQGSKIPIYLGQLRDRYPLAAKKYLKSESLLDILFKAKYGHVGTGEPVTNTGDSTTSDELHEEGDEEEEETEYEEEDESRNSCQLCDQSQIVKRRPRDMRVHYGLIASSNMAINNGIFRNRLNRSLGGKVLCVEMEAAGIALNLPCLIIRGICSYADSHENKAWQEHAAAVAAAYAKELLLTVQPKEVREQALLKEVLG